MAYFYCKEDSGPQVTYGDVIRTLIWQLLDQNPDILLYIDSERTKYSQVPLQRIEDLKELFQKTLAVLENVFIVVDGLDEMESEHRRPLLETFSTIDQTQSTQGSCKVKIFLSSQVLVDIRESLAKFENRIGCPILIADSQDDIRQYIELQSLRIRSKFDLTEAEAMDIVAKVSSHVETSSLFEHMELLEAEICSGDYAFAEYALQSSTWHLRRVSSKKPDPDALCQLLTKWKTFFGSSFVKLTTPAGSVSPLGDDNGTPETYKDVEKQALDWEDACNGTKTLQGLRADFSANMKFDLQIT
ncbi:hypothetical protein ABW21_db0202568 [Orbilia brochopaga]|nr:hypothetical protein ABW21_db0202568 [Drechslerella brochopaga]